MLTAGWESRPETFKEIRKSGKVAERRYIQPSWLQWRAEVNRAPRCGGEGPEVFCRVVDLEDKARLNPHSVRAWSDIPITEQRDTTLQVWRR